VLTFQFVQFLSTHYRVKHRCSKLLHCAVIICIRLLVVELSVRQRMPRGLIILRYLVFTVKNSRQQNS